MVQIAFRVQALAKTGADIDQFAQGLNLVLQLAFPEHEAQIYLEPFFLLQHLLDAFVEQQKRADQNQLIGSPLMRSSEQCQ